MLDEATINQLYAEVAPRVTNYLVANGLEYQVSCDIVQESFIRIWQKRAQLIDSGELSGLVFAIAKNLRTDYFRRNKRLVFQEEISDQDIGDSASGMATSADDLSYLRQQLQLALQKLPEEQREAYTLFQIARQSIREIALATGASESLVKVRIHRAKTKLKVYLADFKKVGDF